MRAASAVFVDARHLDSDPTGVGVWVRALLAEWAALADRPTVVPLTRRATSAPGGVAAAPLRAPGPLWHAVAAWRARRARYLSPDSFIVPILLGRRATLVVHDLTPILLPEAHTRRTRVSHRLLLRLATRRAGLVVVPSAATADDLATFMGRTISSMRIIPDAARRLPVAGPPDDGPPYVLHVGTIEPRKNVDVLVRAFRRVATGSWRLVLVGKMGWLSDRAREDLLHDIDAAGGRIERLGYVEDGRLGRLYADAAVFAYPSSHEGFGLPVVEAMSHGVPVVISDADALVEVAGGAAVVAPLANLEDSLADALDRLMQLSPDERADLSARGRLRAAAFSWESVAADLLAAIRAS